MVAFYNPGPPPEDFPGAVCSSITQWKIPVVSTAACDYSNRKGTAFQLPGSDVTVCIDTQRVTASGASGQIYEAFINASRSSTKIAVKVTKARNASKEEYLLHVILHCAANVIHDAVASLVTVGTLQEPVPFIAGIHFAVKVPQVLQTHEDVDALNKVEWHLLTDEEAKQIEETCTHKVREGPFYCIGMDHLDTTLHDYMVSDAFAMSAKLQVLMQVCVLIDALQRLYCFMHRDLHPGNVMLKYDTTCEGFKVTLIDFGTSSIIVDKCHCKNTGPSTVICQACHGVTILGFTGTIRHTEYAYNPSSDLAKLLTSCHKYQYIDCKCKNPTQKPTPFYKQCIIPIFQRVVMKQHEGIGAEYYARFGAKIPPVNPRGMRSADDIFTLARRSDILPCTPDWTLRQLQEIGKEQVCHACHRYEFSTGNPKGRKCGYQRMQKKRRRQ